MRVLFLITRGDELGGAQTHVKDVILGLKDKFNVECFLACGSKGVFTDIMESNGIDVFHVKSLKREICIYDIKALFEVRKLVKSIKPDIISCHSSKAGVIGRLACIASKTKNTFTAHGWSFTEGINTKKSAIYRKIELTLSYITDAVINVSEYDKDIALQARLRSTHYVVHNCIPDKSPKNYANKRTTVTHFIMVARFCEQKDHETLLKSLSTIDKTKWKLTLVGGGDASEIKELAKNLSIKDNIDFVGQTTKVNDYLSDADVFLLITKWEGFPISIIEAMREGLPVIASNVGGISEAVKHRINGFLIKKESIIDLNEKILEIIDADDLMKQFGSNSRDIYCKYFKLDNMVDSYHNIFSEVIK